MLIATLLSPSQFARVRDVTNGTPIQLVETRDWGHLHGVLREQPVSLVILDPLLKSRAPSRIAHIWNDSSSEAMSILEQSPDIPTIAYTTLTTASASILTALCQLGLSDIILYEYDDAPLRLGYRIRHAIALRVFTRFKAELQRELSGLPKHIERAVHDMLDRPHVFHTENDLVVASGETPEGLAAALHTVGLASPRHLFTAARLSHAITYFCDPELRVQDIAARLGYTRTDVLSRQTLEVLGMHPRHLRKLDSKQAAENVLVARLLAWVREGPHAVSA